MTRPAEHLRGEIRATVREIIASLRGETNAITGEELARLVAWRLGWTFEIRLSHATIKRRCQEAIAWLVDEEGEEIASTGSGYFTPSTREEVEAASRALRHRLIGLARRYRAYDRATGERLLRELGQGSLDLGVGT